MKKQPKEEIFTALFELGPKAVQGRNLSADATEWQFILANGYFARIIVNRNPFIFELLERANNYHTAKAMKPINKRTIPSFPIDSTAAATRAIFSILKQYEPENIPSDGSEKYD